MRSLSILALAAAAAVACQQPPAENLDIDVLNLANPASPIEADAPPRVTRTAHEPPALHATTTVTFFPAILAGQSLSGVHSVIIGVDVIGATGGELALELLTPDGTLYQRPTLPLAADPFAPQHLEFSIPVSGTWIDSMKLTGTWDAHVFLGSAELLHETFELAP